MISGYRSVMIMATHLSTIAKRMIYAPLPNSCVLHSMIKSLNMLVLSWLDFMLTILRLDQTGAMVLILISVAFEDGTVLTLHVNKSSSGLWSLQSFSFMLYSS